MSLERAVDTLEREVCFDLESYEHFGFTHRPPPFFSGLGRIPDRGFND